MSSLERPEFLALFELEEPEKRRGTGRVVPAEFVVPALPQDIAELVSRRGYCAPEDVFVPRPGLAVDHMERLTHRLDPASIVLLTDGACADNGQDGARAAWAFQFGPEHEMRTCSRRLENKGPFGQPARQTSNRAELRAVLGAIRCRPWAEDGYKTIVVATDSEYAVKGATAWIRGWIRNGWKTSGGQPVQNRDLWELLLGDFERYHDAGVKLEFWRIRREANSVADAAAKKACANEDEQDYGDLMVPGI